MSLLDIEERIKPLTVKEKQELYNFLGKELKKAGVAYGFPDVKEFEVATILDIEPCVARNLQKLEIPS